MRAAQAEAGQWEMADTERQDTPKSKRSRLESGDAVLGVVGLGYVGLPLAAEAARHGIRVIGFDVDCGVVDSVNGGLSHIADLPASAVSGARERGLLEATADMKRLSRCDAVSICVPTPLSKTRDPDISHVLAAAEAMAAVLREGQLVVLESTTYPGTTREVVLPILRRSGLEPGTDFHLCFSPERVDPGNETWKTGNTPRIIGGVTPRCTEVGTAFYSRFVDDLVAVSSA